MVSICQMRKDRGSIIVYLFSKELLLVVVVCIISSFYEMVAIFHNKLLPCLW